MQTQTHALATCSHIEKIAFIIRNLVRWSLATESELSKVVCIMPKQKHWNNGQRPKERHAEKVKEDKSSGNTKQQIKIRIKSYNEGISNKSTPTEQAKCIPIAFIFGHLRGRHSSQAQVKTIRPHWLKQIIKAHQSPITKTDLFLLCCYGLYLCFRRFCCLLLPRCCYCCCYVLAIREQDNGLSMFVDGLYCFGNDIGCPCPWQYVYDVSEYKQINVYRNWHTIERSLHFMCVLSCCCVCLRTDGCVGGWAVGLYTKLITRA